jgi:hypothetical protein
MMANANIAIFGSQKAAMHFILMEIFSVQVPFLVKKHASIEKLKSRLIIGIALEAV